MGQAELKLKVADLMLALAGVRTDMAGIQDELRDKDARIAELQAQADLKGRLTYRKPSYWVTDENGAEVGPHCQRCYDVDHKLVRLQDWGEQTLACMACGKTFAE